MGRSVTVPLLSILVPVYNTEKYLSRCIDSILCQTYLNYELILIDDGSTDMSGEICDRYANLNDKIRVIHKENAGLISARFTGLSVARGDYISFVDSDDWLDSNMYEKFMGVLDLNQKVDIVIGGYTINYEDGRSIFPFKLAAEQIYSSTMGLLKMFEHTLFNWSMCDKIYRKRLFEHIQISYANVDYSEDTEFNWKLFRRAKKIYYTPINSYHYYYRDKSMVRTRSFAGNIVHLKRLINILDEINWGEEQLRQTILDLICSLGINYTFEAIDNASPSCVNGIKECQKLVDRYIPLVSKRFSDNEKDKIDLFKMPYEKIHQIINKNYELLRATCIKFCKTNKYVFVYGMGEIANQITNILDKEKLGYCGFVVTDNKMNSFYKNKKVYTFFEVKNIYGNEGTFILGMNRNNCCHVIPKLKNEKFCYINAGQYSVKY